MRAELRRLLLLLAALLCLGFARSEERAPCAHHDPLRQPFFGDLHVHTAFSFDGWGQGTRGTPRAGWPAISSPA